MDRQQMHPMDPRRQGSDTSSYYSGSTNSVWSTSDSVSFVYTEDPYWSWWGYDGVRGAVTRKSDKRDDRRTRVAAHLLRGPFAAHKPKKYHRDSDTRSTYSSSSSSSSSTRRSRAFQRPPAPPMGMPPGPFPGPPQHHPHPQQFGAYPPPPPPPPPQAMPGPPAGFEAGFIQLGGGGGHHQQHHHDDPVWGTDAEYEGETEPEVWD